MAVRGQGDQEGVFSWKHLGHKRPWQSQKGPDNPRSSLTENKSWTGAGPCIWRRRAKTALAREEVRRRMWQRVWPASSRAGTALQRAEWLQNSPAPGCRHGQLVWRMQCSRARIWLCLVPLLLGTLLSLAALLRRNCLTWGVEITAPHSTAGSQSSRPSVRKLVGQADYTKQDKPDDLRTARTGHSLLHSAKGCSVLARWPRCTFLAAGTQSQRWISAAVFC